MIGAATHKLGRTPLILTGAAVFVVTLIASAPASLISAFIDFERSRIAYAEARGTIWKGEFIRTSIAGASLGEVSFELSPLSLLRLAPAVSFAAEGGAVRGQGSLSAGAGRFAVTGINADIDLGAVAPQGVLGQPAQGVARLSIDEVVFTTARGCRTASGGLWTDVLDAPAKRYNLPALPLAGGVSCHDGDLVIALAGENDRAGADITLRIDRTLAYEITATARASEEDIASALRVFGFEDDNGALTYGSVGVFRGAGS
jgi:general secretion pathway protein N